MMFDVKQWIREWFKRETVQIPEPAVMRGPVLIGVHASGRTVVLHFMDGDSLRTFEFMLTWDTDIQGLTK